MYKRARIPMFLWERRACANSGAHSLPRPFFLAPAKNGLGYGNEASPFMHAYISTHIRYTDSRFTGKAAGAARPGLKYHVMVGSGTYGVSLVPRPSARGRGGRPGTHCVRMRLISRNSRNSVARPDFSVLVSSRPYIIQIRIP